MTLPDPPEGPMLPAGTYRGSVILITGGGTGLGRAMAEEFARLGGKIAIFSRSKAHLDAGVAAVAAVGGNAVGVEGDVRDAASIARAFDSVEASLGPVDVLVNNAAGNFEVTAEAMSPNAWRAVTGIVLDGTFFCSTEFARRRIAIGRPGSILNISATYAWTGGPGASHSAAAKAGVNSLTQTLAIEWAPDGIRVNGLAPGVFPHADMDAHWGRGKQQTMTARNSTIPAGRVGQLRELGWAATFLCSPYSSYMTGHTMVLDGGNWLRRHGLSYPEFLPIRDIVAARKDEQPSSPSAGLARGK